MRRVQGTGIFTGSKSGLGLQRMILGSQRKIVTAVFKGTMRLRKKTSGSRGWTRSMITATFLMVRHQRRITPSSSLM